MTRRLPIGSYFTGCQSGSALVEATIVLPLALAMFVGIVDLGLAIQTKAIAEKSMRNAARYLANVPPDAVCTWGWDKAQNLALTGNIAGTAGGYPVLISGWRKIDIYRVQPASCSTTPTLIEIRADVPYTPIIWNSTITMKVYRQERWIGQ